MYDYPPLARKHIPQHLAAAARNVSQVTRGIYLRHIDVMSDQFHGMQAPDIDEALRCEFSDVNGSVVRAGKYWRSVDHTQ
jgi:hypothetical protein